MTPGGDTEKHLRNPPALAGVEGKVLGSGSGSFHLPGKTTRALSLGGMSLYLLSHLADLLLIFGFVKQDTTFIVPAVLDCF